MCSFYLSLSLSATFMHSFVLSHSKKERKEKGRGRCREGKGREGKHSDLEFKIQLDMPDFPIKRKGFPSPCASGIQNWKGLDPLLPPIGESYQSQVQFHKHTKTLGCAAPGWGAKTPSPPPPVGLEVPQARPFPPPNLPGQALFLPSLPHYLLPLTSAPGPRAEGGGWR